MTDVDAEGSYQSVEEGLRTMRQVLADEDEVAAAVLSVQFTGGPGDVQFVCRDEMDYWPVMYTMLAHRIEVMAARADITVEEVIEDVLKTIERREEIRNGN